MEQHRTIIYDGHKIHYRDEGDPSKPTLVLLHGFLQSLEVWNPFLLHLMRSLRVVTIDLPGHGYSAPLGPVSTMEGMAEAVHAVLLHCGVEQCVLVGHSLGGYVALAYAEKHPYFLRGLGLMHSHALPDTAETLERRAQACELVQSNRAGYILSFIPALFDDSKKIALAQEIKDLQDQCLETRTEGIVATLRGMAKRPSRLQVLESLEVPVLFIYGKNDRRIPLEVGVSHAMVPHYAEVMLLDRVAHMSHLEEKDFVRLRLKNFVETCYL